MTELLGINYPAPPDAMPRLQRLRHLFAQGLDFERETVAWLLEQSEARDALADECAELREAVIRAWHGDAVRNAAAAEREACARVVEAMASGVAAAHYDAGGNRVLTEYIDRAVAAAAIRARGETQPPGQAGANTTAGASGAATGGLPAAQVVARFDGPWHHCKTGERRWPASRTEPCPVCGTAWGDAK